MLVLASASPRRQELLRNAGISFAVQPAHIDEDPLPGEPAQDCAERLARDKALAVSRRRPRDWILGADTVVVADGIILGKPNDAADAARMLRLLSGRIHEVITGVCLAGPEKPEDRGQPRDADKIERTSAASQLRTENWELGTDLPRTDFLRTASESTLVTMSGLSEDEIRDYIATGEPMDKAGAYAIQGMASRWIPKIEGDYSNVVGLPVELVCRMLREAGYF